MPEPWITWTAWCHQCGDEWHTGITPVEVVEFANNHIHPGIKCMPDFLFDQLANQALGEAVSVLYSSEGEQ